MAAKLSDLRSHARTTKHVRAAQPFSSARQSKIKFTNIDHSLKYATNEAEGQLALFIAEHTAFLTTDHVVEVSRKAFRDSKQAPHVKMHRTKCKEMLVNVLGPHFNQCLREDIGDAKYSLIIDESTDISVVKLLGVVIRYFSQKLQKIISTHLGLVEIESGTAASIVCAIKKLLEDVDLNPKKLLGVGVDNASVNTGLNNGVCELLKREFGLPKLFMIRCVCQSIQLAVSHSVAETLPRILDFLVKETYNWFGHSSKRQLMYKQLFATINDGKQPLQIPRVCDTRWLSIEPAVTRILSQWDELKLHFEITRSSEKCYTAESLFDMYSDPVNKLYLLFMRPILQETQRTMKTFQGENTDPMKLLLDLSNLIISLSKKVTIPTARVNPLTTDISSYIDPGAYMGYEFEKVCRESQIAIEVQGNIRQRCISFVVKLCSELRNRLPDNFEALRKISRFSVHECLNQVKDPITEIAEIFGCDYQNIEKVENQWRNLTIVQWQEKKSTAKFWIEVGNYRDASDCNPFQELHEIAIGILSLPHSNAEVERLFSQHNIIKNKLRNRLSLKSVNSVLAIRNGLKRLEKNCHTYDIPKTVLEKIGTMAAYSVSYSGSSNSTSPVTAFSTLVEDDDDLFLFSLQE
ncbi:uncharacterized protein [Palaemon carinicauda]|uniref:uncharacterized protein n=1 Tax=Palaemon carinicauda TaxID=392227 RepID=UPI0035B5A6CA